MSVTFTVSGIVSNWETGERFVNMANLNACDVLLALGLDTEYLDGSERCRDFVAACDRALAVEQAGDRPRLGHVETGAQGATVFHGGRREGYVTEKIRALRELAAQGGDLGRICWG